MNAQCSKKLSPLHLTIGRGPHRRQMFDMLIDAKVGTHATRSLRQPLSVPPDLHTSCPALRVPWHALTCCTGQPEDYRPHWEHATAPCCHAGLKRH